MRRALLFAAQNGRWCLVGGLVAGVALPGLALAMRPTLPWLIALLLFISAFRIGPRDALGRMGDIRHTLALVAVYQLGAPLLALAFLSFLGLMSTPLALAFVLMLSAPSITGAPNFTILLGHDPSAAMRLLLVGTAVFPLTALPILGLLPALGGAEAVIWSALKLLAVIVGVVGLAFALRTGLAPELSMQRYLALDGAAAIVLAVIVIGLMSAVTPSLATNPLRVLAFLIFAFVANFGTQVIAWRVQHRSDGDPKIVAQSIVSGNRNIALFLVALPPAVTDQILLFIGCYQVPMYLTPVLMRWLYKAPSGSSRGI